MLSQGDWVEWRQTLYGEETITKGVVKTVQTRTRPPEWESGKESTTDLTAIVEWSDEYGTRETELPAARLTRILPPVGAIVWVNYFGGVYEATVTNSDADRWGIEVQFVWSDQTSCTTRVPLRSVHNQPPIPEPPPVRPARRPSKRKPKERVLGDSIDDQPEERKTDALGRGLKGYGHGSIDYKQISRKRKSGRVWQSYQAWYQWEDGEGKHCRYLSKQQVLVVKDLLEHGATVDDVLEAIDSSRERRKKTR